MVKFKPLGNNVLVKPLKKGEQKKGDLILPFGGTENLAEGEVVALGPGGFFFGYRQPLDFAVGDKVVWNKETRIQIYAEEGEEYFLIDANSILGIKK